MMQDHNKNRSSPALVHNQDRSHVFAEEGIERCLSEISLRKEHDTMPMIPLRTKRSDFDTMPMIPLRTKRSDFDTMPMIPLRTKRSDFGTSSTTSLETSKSGKGSTVPVFLGDGDLDLTLILGLERTLFAALNNAWLLAIGGIGLMSVGSDDNRANYAGIVILCGGIISSMIAYGMHFLRVWQMRSGNLPNHSYTLVWAGVVAVFTLSTLILELHFGILYPYLNREKAVTIAD